MTSFKKSLETQAQALTLVQNTSFPVILGFEFYPVVLCKDIQTLENRQELKTKGFDIVASQDAETLTVHSPGQLIIYPVVPLQALKITEQNLAFVLKNATESWLKSLHLKKSDEIVTISRNQVCININNDLDLFAIVEQTQSVPSKNSLEKQGIQMDLRSAFDTWINHFSAYLLEAIPTQGQA